ncbi:MAG: hypothetical protein GY950_25605, partial [bacterium]|nr:hypothetical protein [bacterium]
NWLLDIALDHLTLGRAWLMQAQKVEAREEAGKKSAEAWDRARVFLDQAVTGLRESQRLDCLPLGLLARASYYRLQGDFAPAWRDVTEAGEIAETGGMVLHLCDHHLEAARLCRAEGKNTEATDYFEKAAVMIEKMGYHRRKEGKNSF